MGGTDSFEVLLLTCTRAFGIKGQIHGGNRRILFSHRRRNGQYHPQVYALRRGDRQGYQRLYAPEAPTCGIGTMFPYFQKLIKWF
jgi:hypothetical protein